MHKTTSCRGGKFHRAFPIGRIIVAVVTIAVMATMYLAGCAVKKAQSAVSERYSASSVEAEELLSE